MLPKPYYVVLNQTHAMNENDRQCLIIGQNCKNLGIYVFNLQLMISSKQDPQNYYKLNGNRMVWAACAFTLGLVANTK